MDEIAIRKELIVGLEYSFLHDAWVTPLEEALDGVTVEEALKRQTQDAKSIWEIVLHLGVWNENIVERVETGKATRPLEGHWPPLPETTDEAAWETAKNRLRLSLKAVRETIETVPFSKIENSPYGIGDLLCRFTHNAYHIGQITKMRGNLDA